MRSLSLKSESLGSRPAFALFRSLGHSKSWVSLLLPGWLWGSSETIYLKVLFLQLSKINYLFTSFAFDFWLLPKVQNFLQDSSSFCSGKRATNMIRPLGVLGTILRPEAKWQRLQGPFISWPFAFQAIWLFSCFVINTSCPRRAPCRLTSVSLFFGPL